MKALFDRFDVGKKFVLTLIQIMIAVAINVIVLLLLLGQADNNIEEFFTKTYVSVQSQLLIRNEADKINLRLVNMLSNEDASSVEADRDAIKKSDEAIEAEIEKIKKLSPDATGMDGFAASYHKSETAAERVGQLILSKDSASAAAAYKSDYIPAFSSMSASAEELGSDANTKAGSVITTYQTRKRNAFLSFAVIAALALGVTGYVLGVFKSSLVGPLKKILAACTDLGNGQPIEELHIESKDEFGAMANSFMDMSRNLEFIVGDTCRMLSSGADKNLNVRSEDESKYVGKYRDLIDAIYKIFADISKDMKLTNDIAEQVSAGSGQISSVSQTLSQGTTEQASAIEQLSSTVTNIAELSETNAADAGKASEISVESAQGVIESNDCMTQMLDAMNKITDTSREIGKIVKAIDDIAFQTNILSLNAAVEAARAGDAGKGFAVVAEEVRNLAQRSAEAAKSTTSLVESTVSAIDHGRKIADSTAQSLQLVKEKTNFVSNTIVRIAEASRNQASATEQVLQGIDQVSTVVQTNSATAEESAAAAEELAAQARTLSSMTSQYRLFQTT